MQKTHSLCIRILSYYLNTYITEWISKQISICFSSVMYNTEILEYSSFYFISKLVYSNYSDIHSLYHSNPNFIFISALVCKPGTLGFVNSLPKFLNTLNQLFLGVWLYLTAHKLFHLVPQVLNGVEIRWLGCCLPPINPILHKKCLDTTRSVFRVVVLHKTVAMWELCRNER